MPNYVKDTKAGEWALFEMPSGPWYYLLRPQILQADPERHDLWAPQQESLLPCLYEWGSRHANYLIICKKRLKKLPHFGLNHTLLGAK
jgi:hypothetical protein